MIKLCIAVLHPEYHVGYMIAGNDGSPSVLYAMKASGISPPDLREKVPSL